jgi:hypothetical protein
MGNVNLEAVSKYGVMQETPAHRLPPEAWTRARNVRFVDNRAERFGGHAQVMGTPSGAPAFVMAVDNAGDVFWLYAEAVGAGSQVFAYNSGTHNDISNVGGYTVSNYRDWNGDVFQGVPILNYGGGVPQYWPTPNVADDLDDLPAWPASTTAKIIRAFGNYLVALNITDTNGAHPHRVLWSDGAGPGELPASWDVTDPAFDADHRDLSDINSGAIIDGIAMRDFFVIGKNESLWIMRYIGGTLIHSVKPALKTAGPMCARVMIPLNIGKSKLETAFMMTGDDLGTFDGQDFLSVVEDRDRKFLSSDIDAVNFENSFVLDNRSKDEAWFCYPENGETDPSVACVWNYKENTITFRDFEGVAAANGPVEGATSSTWATVMGTWATQGPSKWQEASRRKVVVADQDSTKLLQLESSDTFDGTSFSTVLERVGLAVTGQDRDGNPIVNYQSRKIITRVWPKITGGPVLIQVGGSDTPDVDSVVWGTGVVFDPADGSRFCDPAGEGNPLNCVYSAIRFSSTGDEPWKLEGYTIEISELSSL